MDKTLIIVALIAALPPTLVALLGLRKSHENSKAIQEVHLTLNSRLDSLILTEKNLSKIQGIEEGRNEKPNA